MDDLIKRQDAIDAISCNIVITGKRNAEEVASTIGTFVDRIKALPSAEPKTGRWIEMVDADPMTGEPYVCGVYCSECGERIGCESNFCPNCGAYMRGKQDETENIIRKNEKCNG